MPGDHLCLTSLQLADILVVHIVSKLHVHDIQRLACCCTQLHMIVNTAIPAASWQKTAAMSFPSGHPLLKCDAAEVFPRLRRLARAHAAIAGGELAACYELEVGHMPGQELHALAISPCGTLIIAKHESDLVLSRVGKHGAPPALQAQEAWRAAAPPAPPPWKVVNCEFSWTPDNSTIAMKYTPFNGTVDDGLIRSGSDLAIAWNVLYVIDVVTQQLQEVARTPDYSRLLHVLLLRDTVFSPDSRQGSSSNYIQVFSKEDGTWPCLFDLDLPDSDSGFGGRFSPSSSLLALTRVAECAVYGPAGELVAMLPCPQEAGGTVQHVEWAPAGDRLACWASQPPGIHVFDAGRWDALAVVPFVGFLQLTRGLMYGLRDMVHVSLAVDAVSEEAVTLLRARDIESSSSVMRHALPFLLPHTTSDLHVNNQPMFQEVLPVFNPDSTFLALVDRAFRLHVIHCSSRTEVFQRQISLPRTTASESDRSDSVAQLQWVHGGNALLVVSQVENVDPPLAVQASLLEFIAQ